VVKDIKVVTIGERPTPQIFYPLYQYFESQVNLIARTRGDPAVTAVALRQALKEIDPAMPIIASGVLLDQVTTALFPVRFAALLLVVLGLAGLAIAAIGLYGIIAQGVAARTRELGIRLALGAEPGVLRRMVLGDGLKLAGLGLGVGVGLAAVSSRVLESWLYGVSALDPVAFLIAPLVLLMVAALACLLPARRATRVDPVDALRAE
jgi:predicted lysophospholipase L1 biosynthesis ABC-type transport system permease subunit